MIFHKKGFRLGVYFNENTNCTIIQKSKIETRKENMPKMNEFDHFVPPTHFFNRHVKDTRDHGSSRGL